MFVISIAAIIAWVILFGHSNHSGTAQKDAITSGPTPPAQQAPSPFSNFFQPQMSGPMYSPGKGYIWDHHHQTWIRHYSFGDLVMYLILGFLGAVGLLYYFGFIQ